MLDRAGSRATLTSDRRGELDRAAKAAINRAGSNEREDAMPEADKEGERYQAETPQLAPGFFLKGSHQLDWGMPAGPITPLQVPAS